MPSGRALCLSWLCSGHAQCLQEWPKTRPKQETSITNHCFFFCVSVFCSNVCFLPLDWFLDCNFWAHGPPLGSSWPLLGSFWTQLGPMVLNSGSSKALQEQFLFSLGHLLDQFWRVSCAPWLAFGSFFAWALNMVAWAGTSCCAPCLALVDWGALSTLCLPPFGAVHLDFAVHLVMHWFFEVLYPHRVYSHVMLCNLIMLPSHVDLTIGAH